MAQRFSVTILIYRLMKGVMKKLFGAKDHCSRAVGEMILISPLFTWQCSINICKVHCELWIKYSI